MSNSLSALLLRSIFFSTIFLQAPMINATPFARTIDAARKFSSGAVAMRYEPRR
jgi:hypothetical protein